MKLAVLLVACGSNDEPPVAKPARGLELGSCTLEVSGPSTITEVTPAEVELSYWAPHAGKEHLVVTCAGAQVSLSFTARDQTKAMLPPAPRKYPISPADHVVELTGRLNELRLAYPDGWFEITALDETHIAGTFELRTLFSHQATRIAGKVKGRFDIKCPHAPCTKP